jgi:putative transposase
LPSFLSSIKNINGLFPVLYLKGISIDDFEETPEALSGEGPIGLSASNITRLKHVREDEYGKWHKQDLIKKHYAYIWVDGIYFNICLNSNRQRILVMVGETVNGKKDPIIAEEGYRESRESWQALLHDLEIRGLSVPPSIATADGVLGFWTMPCINNGEI